MARQNITDLWELALNNNSNIKHGKKSSRKKSNNSGVLSSGGKVVFKKDVDISSPAIEPPKSLTDKEYKDYVHQNKKLKSARLSAALKGKPHGPYVMPSEIATIPVDPRTVYDSGSPTTVFVEEDSELHRLYGKPRLPKNYFRNEDGTYGKYIKSNGVTLKVQLTPGEQAKIDKTFDYYNKALADYNNQKYHKQKRDYEDWVNRLYAWYERIEQVPINKNLRALNKQKADALRVSRRKRKKDLEAVFNNRIAPSVYADISPFNPEYGNKKRWTKKQLESMGVDYGTYRTPKTKTISTTQGVDVEVIDNTMFVPLGFNSPVGYKEASNVEYWDGTTMLDKYERYFDGKHKIYSWHGQGDCGHILAIEYSRFSQMMKVTFRAGDIVVYDHIPYAVALELIALGEGGYTSHNSFDGTARHLVGIRFWDLVRIRGTQSGSQYPYHYVSKGYDRSTVDYKTYPRAQERYIKKTNKEILSTTLDDILQQELEDASTEIVRASTGIDKKAHAWRSFNDFTGNEDEATTIDSFTEEMKRLGKSDDYINNKIDEALNLTRMLAGKYDAALVKEKSGGNDTRGLGTKRVNKNVFNNVSMDNLSGYFNSALYSRDIGNSNLDRKGLQKAYDMFNNNEDPQKIVQQLLKAGGNLLRDELIF